MSVESLGTIENTDATLMEELETEVSDFNGNLEAVRDQLETVDLEALSPEEKKEALSKMRIFLGFISLAVVDVLGALTTTSTMRFLENTSDLSQAFVALNLGLAGLTAVRFGEAILNNESLDHFKKPWRELMEGASFIFSKEKQREFIAGLEEARRLSASQQTN